MKVLVLNYEYPPIGGGGAPVSRDIAENMAARGHDVTVVTMKYKKLPFFTLENNVKVYRLNCLRSRKASCLPHEQFSYLISVMHFLRRNKELQNCDICHAHFIVPTGYAAYLINKKYGIPYILTAHGSDVEGHNSKKYMVVIHRLIRGIWKKIVKYSKCVVSPSYYLINLMKNNYTDGNYIMIRNGVDLNFFKSCNRKYDKKREILIMGRLQRFKNVQFFLKAFSQTTHKEWHVNIVGDGPYREDLQSLVKELNISDRVSFIGWLDHKSHEISKYLIASSIFVSASQFENCPMGVVEAAAAGCYPLVSDIEAHREMPLSDEHYFNINSTEELIDRLNKLMIRFPIDYKFDMITYSLNNVVDQYEEIYIDL